MPLIARAQTPEDLALVRELLTEYRGDIESHLSQTCFAAELEALPGAYGPPRGELLLATVFGQAAGCVALRPIAGDSAACEMKRLYVRPAFRGRRLGRVLAEAIVLRARELGYASMKLDTLDSMHAAHALYQALGFVPVGHYGAATPGGDVRCLALELMSPAHAGALEA